MDHMDLALANILDVVPFIENTGVDVNRPLNQALVRLYERNLAAFNLPWDNLTLVLANTLDIVPYINNFGNDVNGPLNRALVRIYERNIAALNR